VHLGNVVIADFESDYEGTPGPIELPHLVTRIVDHWQASSGAADEDRHHGIAQSRRGDQRATEQTPRADAAAADRNVRCDMFDSRTGHRSLISSA
jgi:hypothetical protein